MKDSRLSPDRERQVRSAIGLAAEARPVPAPARASRIVNGVRRLFAREASWGRRGDPGAEMARQFEAWG